MTIITNVRSKGKGSTDPRFKNGVFVNRRGQREDETRRLQQAMYNCNPLNFGWEVTGYDEKRRVVVYSQLQFELRWLADKNGWGVNRQGNDDGWAYPDHNAMQATQALALQTDPRFGTRGPQNLYGATIEYGLEERSL